LEDREGDVNIKTDFNEKDYEVEDG
jgi:hypothetical protein